MVQELSIFSSPHEARTGTHHSHLLFSLPPNQTTFLSLATRPLLPLPTYVRRLLAHSLGPGATTRVGIRVVATRSRLLRAAARSTHFSRGRPCLGIFSPWRILTNGNWDSALFVLSTKVLSCTGSTRTRSGSHFSFLFRGAKRNVGSPPQAGRPAGSRLDRARRPFFRVPGKKDGFGASACITDWRAKEATTAKKL
jgi:hypothetical protein